MDGELRDSPRQEPQHQIWNSEQEQEQEQRREGGGAAKQKQQLRPVSVKIEKQHPVVDLCLWCCCCWQCTGRCLGGGPPSGSRKVSRNRGVGMGSDERNDIAEEDLEGTINADAQPPPEHLVILVNGIIGSAKDWTFAAGRLRSRLGRRVAIHCSEASAAMKTLDGVDVMGKRLADEVRVVIGKTPGVTKISFLAHSLGGLVSRYAISQLYCPPMHNANFGDGVTDPRINSKILTEAAQSEFTIAGLQAENFITLATPHLGCRGAQQLPFLLGIETLEKTASIFAHWIVGKSGRHLFLTDGSGDELPLLRKMATNCKEGQFISSLGLFKKRTAYANMVKDQLVGWRTASIRRKSELPEMRHDPFDPKYPHIIREEDPVPPSEKDVHLANERPADHSGKPVEDSLEEEMVAGLNQVPWHRVDASFNRAKGSYQAHNLMQVKNVSLHYEGRDVIDHVIDKQFAE